VRKNKKYSRQQIQKLFHGECLICGETNYDLLDAHRIIEGGDYKVYNIVILCANDHRRVHAGEIKIDRKYETTLGKIMVHYWVNGEEFWKVVKN
jgi:predicted restriction endonuclease